MMSWCLYKARKYLQRDFGLWVEASLGNPGHRSVKWVPVVSSECKGLYFPCLHSLVCTVVPTQPFCQDYMMNCMLFWDQYDIPLNHDSRGEMNKKALIEQIIIIMQILCFKFFFLSWFFLRFSQQWLIFGELSVKTHPFQSHRIFKLELASLMWHISFITVSIVG